MSLTEKLLGFFFQHNAAFVQLAVLLLLIASATWLFLHLRVESKEEMSMARMKDVEEAVRRVVGSTGNTTAAKMAMSIPDEEIPMPAPKTGPAGASVNPPPATAGVPVGAAAPAATGAGAMAGGTAPVPAAPMNTAELDKMKTDLADRDRRLADLEKALNGAKTELTAAQAAAQVAAQAQASGGAAPAAGGTDTTELKNRLAELESRLSEYEIIEDDIANLSLYKDENARLKNELEKLKTSGGAQDATAALAAVVAPAPAAAPTAPVTPAPVAAAPSAPVSEPEHTPPAPNIDKLTEEALKMADVPAAAAPAAAPGGDDAQAEVDRILQESRKKAESAAPAQSAAAPAADTNAIPAAPVADIPELATAAATGTIVSDSTPNDQGQKLIDEFQNFLKGG